MQRRDRLDPKWLASNTENLAPSLENLRREKELPTFAQGITEKTHAPLTNRFSARPVPQLKELPIRTKDRSERAEPNRIWSYNDISVPRWRKDRIDMEDPNSYLLFPTLACWLLPSFCIIQPKRVKFDPKRLKERRDIEDPMLM
jgi:hypothetical protein